MIDSSVNIILASGSPRRKKILSEIVKAFAVIPSSADESLPEGITPRAAVELLARRKAESVCFGREGALIIGADTVVAYNGKILGKPSSEEDAAKTLKTLSGNEHSVYTGVCVIYGGKIKVASEESKVLFFNLTDRFIKEYVESGSPMDKAGSYGIQDGGIVQSFTGSYTNIVGLPKELTEKMIEEILLKDD